jgi:protein-tyrosine phosphatase
MTEEHYRFLRANAPAQCPADLILFMGIVKENTDVPDPYYGGDAGFERMIDMLEQGCGALIEQFS